MPDSQAINVKKRLMFVKGEDFYYLAYNILVLLNELGCTGAAKPFKDHRKLAFLVDFVADPKLIEIVRRRRSTTSLNPRDRQELVRAYSDGTARIHLVSRLISAIEVRGLIHIDRDPDSSAANLYLSCEAVPMEFFASDLYEQERVNVTSLKEIIPRLRTATLAAMLKGLFEESGVQVWHT